jgi:glycosyltransferase involved in cell wall biosynthesis
MSPEKRVDRAIEIARRAGMPLKIAAKIYPEERGYFDEELAPLLESSRPLVGLVGEIGNRERDELLGGAAASSCRSSGPSPSGWSIEAMACGTPVVAWRRGSVPEVVEDRVTGYVVETIEEAVSAVGRVGDLSRTACRRVFEERFGVARMARDYVEVYRGLITGC